MKNPRIDMVLKYEGKIHSSDCLSCNLCVTKCPKKALRAA